MEPEQNRVEEKDPALKNEEIEETNEEQTEEINEDGTNEETNLDTNEEESPELADPTDISVAQYKIVGLVDYMDEQGNIVGQYPIDSIQTLPTFVGDKAVELGLAEKVQ